MSTAKVAKSSKAKPLAVDSVTQTPAPRFWPAVVLLVAFWGFRVGYEWVEMAMSMRFLSRMIANLLLLVLFFAWWLTNRRVSRADRWRAFGVFIAGAIGSGLLAHKSIGMFSIVFGLPYVLTVWTAWLFISKSLVHRTRELGFCALVLLTWFSCDLLRWDGLDGGQHDKLAWRWSPTAEQLFLAGRGLSQTKTETVNGPGPNSPSAVTVEPTIKVLSVSDDDWPEFRGPARDDRVHAPAA